MWWILFIETNNGKWAYARSPRVVVMPPDFPIYLIVSSWIVDEYFQNNVQ